MTTKCTERTGRNAPGRHRVVEAHARSSRHGDPSARARRIESLRRAIADGSYETDEKIDVTARRLLRDLLIRG